MKAINPRINFNGNAEEAFNFYKSVLSLNIPAYEPQGLLPMGPSISPPADRCEGISCNIRG